MLLAGAAAIPFGTAGVFDGCDGGCVAPELLFDSVLTSAGVETGPEVPFV